MKQLDDFLNSVTMYRLILYILIFYLLTAGMYSLMGLLPFTFLQLFLSATFILLICWSTNTLMARIFKAVTNVESVYISGLILSLIINPASSFADLQLLAGAGVLAMASKYLLAINKKHIFNPAAVGVFLTSILINKSASWWIGDLYMLPFVLIGGLLVVRKIKKWSLVLSFLITTIATSIIFYSSTATDVTTLLSETIMYSPLIFFTTIMLTEPFTIPSTRKWQLAYGVIVGLLFNHIPQFQFSTTPEIALLIGNVFSYLVSPKWKLYLKLKEKTQTSPETYDFLFELGKKMIFMPGQYLEWTLGFPDPDSRGNRRYFTIASSPTENNLRIGIKFYKDSSAFKKTLINFKPGDKIIASSLAGEFTLPQETNKKLVFIAGGIGITPFRSIIKNLLDLDQKRDIILFYSNNKQEDIIYRDIFEAAENKFGMKTVYNLTDIQNIPSDWKFEKGYVNTDMIKKHVLDYKDRYFYISGPHSMVTGVEETLKKLGVRKDYIKTDFFPGYA